MNARIFTIIALIPRHAVVRPCSILTAPSPTSGKKYLQ